LPNGCWAGTSKTALARNSISPGHGGAGIRYSVPGRLHGDGQEFR
jgi:hypothetical protein